MKIRLYLLIGFLLLLLVFSGKLNGWKSRLELGYADMWNPASFARFVADEDLEIIHKYIAAGMSPDSANYGDPVLIIAVRANKTAAAKKLLEAGANPNLKSGQGGQTALIIAATQGNDEIIQELIKHHAKINEKDSTGWTALNYAEQGYSVYDRRKAAALLKQAGGTPGFVQAAEKQPPAPHADTGAAAVWIEKLKGEDRYEKVSAVAELKKIAVTNPEVVDPLFQALPDAPPELAQQIFEALDTLSKAYPQVYPFIIQGLGSQSNSIRDAAYRLLKNIPVEDRKTALPFLIPQRHSNPYSGAQAIIDFGPAADLYFNEIVRDLDNPDGQIRYNAVNILAAMDPDGKRTPAVFSKLANDPLDSVRERVKQILAGIKTAETKAAP